MLLKYYRAGFLAVLCRDSSVVKLYDIRHSVIGTEELEPVIFDRTLQRKSACTLALTLSLISKKTLFFILLAGLVVRVKG